MFNIAFPELMVILVVALIVIGPEKLPKLVRGTGLVMGRFQRYLSDIKSDINAELKTEDLQRLQEELNQYDQGLNEELRQGIKPVAEVLEASTQAREQARRADQASEPAETAPDSNKASTPTAALSVKAEHST